MSVQLRPAGADDIEQVLAMDRTHSPVFGQLSSYTGLLESDGLLMLAVEQESLLGFAACSRVLDEASLLNLVVQPRQRRRGLARKLLNVCVQLLRERGVKRLLLEVRESNRSARALYAGLGFAVDAERRNYYSGGGDDAAARESALLMSLNLENCNARA